MQPNDGLLRTAQSKNIYVALLKINDDERFLIKKKVYTYTSSYLDIYVIFVNSLT